MKQKTYLCTLLAAAALLGACSNEENLTTPVADGTAVSFTLGDNGIMTRSLTTEESAGYKTVIQAAEQIGIYGKGTTAATSNVLATVNTDGNGLTPSAEIKIGQSSTALFTAYTPYTANAGETLAFSVKSDQSTATDFNASNLLTAKSDEVTASSPSVSLTFEPRLALVRVEMAGAEGINTSAVKVNAKPQVTWTAATDALSEAAGTATDITMWHQNAAADEVASQIFAAFVPAQDITAGASFLTMTVGEKQYRFKPKSNFSLAAGKINKFKVTIGASGEITIESITIDVKDWEVNDLTTIEGEVEEIVPEPEPAIELISEAEGTPTANTTINESLGIRGTKEGWNAVLTTATTTTIAYDATNEAIKIANDATGSWYQKALVYRTANGKGSLGEYTIKFSVKTSEGYDIQMRIMRGQISTASSTDDPDTFFCIGTGTFGATYIKTTTGTTNAPVKGEWIEKSFTINLAKLGTSASTAADATTADFANGIAVVIACKTATEAQDIYIKDLTFIEVKE